MLHCPRSRQTPVAISAATGVVSCPIAARSGPARDGHPRLAPSSRLDPPPGRSWRVSSGCRLRHSLVESHGSSYRVRRASGLRSPDARSFASGPSPACAPAGPWRPATQHRSEHDSNVALWRARSDRLGLSAHGPRLPRAVYFAWTKPPVLTASTRPTSKPAGPVEASSIPWSALRPTSSRAGSTWRSGQGRTRLGSEGSAQRWPSIDRAAGSIRSSARAAKL
jgi:hypothetical protein